MTFKNLQKSSINLSLPYKFGGILLQEEKLKNAFQKTLGLPPNTDYSSIIFARTEGWDSIAHMQLIAAIEEAYDIMLDTQDVLAMSSYPVAKTIVEKHVCKSFKS
jgi:acyl carrier protein